MPLSHRWALPPLQRTEGAFGVLDVTEWYGETSGGIRTYLDEKARYIAERPDLRHVVIVPGERDAVLEGDGCRQYRLRGPRIPRHRPYRFLLASRSISRIVRHEHPRVIEVGSPFLVPWIVRPVCRSMQVPIVCFHHTNVSGLIARAFDASPSARTAARRVAHAYLRRLHGMAAATLVASRSAREELEEAGVERIVDVPLGVDTQTFSPTQRTPAVGTRARWGLPGGPLAGYVGRFASEKELLLLLSAWPAVEAATDARLVLIGTGPDEERLRAHPYAPRVLFLPYIRDRDQLAALMAMLDVIVAPSPLETFGLAPLEALACGTPVLSADRGGVAEQVAASGAGAVFESGRPDSLAERAIALFSGDLSALGARGREFAVARHAWPIVLDRLFAVYHSLAA